MKTSFLLSALALAAGLALSGCGDVSGSVSIDAVQPEGAAFTLTVDSSKALVLQGGSATLTVQLQRKAGFDGAVELTLAGLPAGVSALPASIAAGATSATVTLQAGASAPHSLPTAVTLQGSAGTQRASHGLTVTVRGLPGVVDTSFAAGGKSVQPVDGGEDYAYAAAVQPDGRLLVAGSSAGAGGTKISLLRYERDGALDTSFGSGGKVTAPAGGLGNDQALAAAVQRDGRILVAGRTEGATGHDFVLMRFTAAGAPDASFGSGGKVVIDFAGGTDVARALLVLPDDRIVVAGEALLPGTGLDFALARLLPDGTLDTSFGQGGKVTTPMKADTGSDTVRALVLHTVQGEARVLAVGGDGDFQAARYTASGALDAGFAQGGRLQGVFGSVIGGAHAATVLPDGRTVLAGHVDHDFALVQIHADGTLDAGFGSGGKVLRPVSANWDEATAVVRQADGKLVVGGWCFSGNGSSADFVAMRLDADGRIDTGFGQAGVAINPIANGTLSDQAHALVLQADERLPAVRALQAGEANGSNNDVAVTRYWL